MERYGSSGVVCYDLGPQKHLGHQTRRDTPALVVRVYPVYLAGVPIAVPRYHSILLPTRSSELLHISLEETHRTKFSTP